MTQSQHFGKKQRIIVTQPSPTIPEVESDEDVNVPPKFETINETKRSTSKENVAKKSSIATKRTSVSSKNGFDNPSYEGPEKVIANGSRKNSRISPTPGNFNRAQNVSSSVRSSMHDPSVASME